MKIRRIILPLVGWALAVKVVKVVKWHANLNYALGVLSEKREEKKERPQDRELHFYTYNYYKAPTSGPVSDTDKHYTETSEYKSGSCLQINDYPARVEFIFKTPEAAWIFRERIEDLLRDQGHVTMEDLKYELCYAPELPQDYGRGWIDISNSGLEREEHGWALVLPPTTLLNSKPQKKKRG